jgi:hypothetical protein
MADIPLKSAGLVDYIKFKHWREQNFQRGGPDNYIDYLVAIGVLEHRQAKQGQATPRMSRIARKVGRFLGPTP